MIVDSSRLLLGVLLELSRYYCRISRCICRWECVDCDGSDLCDSFLFDDDDVMMMMLIFTSLSFKKLRRVAVLEIMRSIASAEVASGPAKTRLDHSTEQAHHTWLP